MQQDYGQLRHTPAQITALQAESSRQPLRTLEPNVGTCEKPVSDQKMDSPLADLFPSERCMDNTP